MSVIEAMRRYVAEFTGQCEIDFEGNAPTLAVELTGSPDVQYDLAGNRAVRQDFAVKKRCFLAQGGDRQAAHDELCMLLDYFEGALPQLDDPLVAEAVEVGGITADSLDSSGQTGVLVLEGVLVYTRYSS